MKNDNFWSEIRTAEYYGKICRLYNERVHNSLFTLYIETVFKIHELIEKYNFEVYYFKGIPLTNLKITLKNQSQIDAFNEDVKKIKYFQSCDLFYLYLNMFFEVIYFFPYIDKNNNYSYSFLILVKKDFDIKKIINHNFNVIKIIDYNKIEKSGINYEFIKNVFESATFINNVVSTEGEYDFNSISVEKCNLREEIFIADYNKGNTIINRNDWRREYLNYSTINVDYNCYALNNFKRLCTHIWSLDREFYVDDSKIGPVYRYDEIYNIDSMFLTNFNKLSDLKQVITKDNGIIVIKEHDAYPCSLRDNFMWQGICECSLPKEYIINGFIDFSNKQWKKSGEDY